LIIDINFDSRPIEPGESRPLYAISDAGSIYVAIRCFREPPHPPQLTQCQECGSYKLAPGEHFVVTASHQTFADHRGYLSVIVSDESGDKREFTLSVEATASWGA